MPRKEKLRFAINIGLSGLISVLIHCLPYKRFTKHFGNACNMLMASSIISHHQIQQALSIKQSINRAVRYTPWKSTCLTQALMAIFWCKRARTPYFLFVGIEKKLAVLSQKEAHAWVTVGPISVTGGGQQCFETHHVISSFSNAR